MQDEAAAQRLVKIARRHCKLALEHGDRNTLPERRVVIKTAIVALREERSQILASYNS